MQTILSIKQCQKYAYYCPVNVNSLDPKTCKLFKKCVPLFYFRYLRIGLRRYEMYDGVIHLLSQMSKRSRRCNYLAYPGLRDVTRLFTKNI